MLTEGKKIEFDLFFNKSDKLSWTNNIYDITESHPWKDLPYNLNIFLHKTNKTENKVTRSENIIATS